MALHMIKLCVGVENVEDLQGWQDRRMKERKKRGEPVNPYHETRMGPKRAAEMLDGGSLYWVIKHMTIVRQRLIGFEAVTDKDGKAMCRIHLDPQLVRTEARKKRPFQGWRYLTAADAPPDVDGASANISANLEAALKDALVW